MLIKFLGWCCGINVKQLLDENKELRNERDKYINKYIKNELENMELKKEIMLRKSYDNELIFSDDIERIHSLSDFLNDFDRRIKPLEDNAFSDRARIGVLENKVEELEKYVKQLEKDLIHVTNGHSDRILNIQDRLSNHNF